MRRFYLTIAGAAILVASFFGTSWFLEQQDLSNKTVIYPPLVRGQALSFQDGANRRVLLSGWSGPESWGVWSDGTEAKLGFVVSGLTGKTAKIVISGGPFIIAGKLPQQKIEVWSSNIKLADIVLTTGTKEFSVPLNVANGDTVVLRLLLPNATAPKDLQIGNIDTRKLAFAITSIRMDE